MDVASSLNLNLATDLATGGLLAARKSWSERRDLNSGPLAPHASALPDCATLRHELFFLEAVPIPQPRGAIIPVSPVRCRGASAGFWMVRRCGAASSRPSASQDLQHVLEFGAQLAHDLLALGDVG